MEWKKETRQESREQTGSSMYPPRRLLAGALAKPTIPRTQTRAEALSAGEDPGFNGSSCLFLFINSGGNESKTDILII